VVENTKREKENSKEEEKASLQSNLSGFFGITQKCPSSKFEGTAKYQEFPA
jgi:hypothetical protein